MSLNAAYLMARMRGVSELDLSKEGKAALEILVKECGDFAPEYSHAMTFISHRYGLHGNEPKTLASIAELLPGPSGKFVGRARVQKIIERGIRHLTWLVISIHGEDPIGIRAKYAVPEAQTLREAAKYLWDHYTVL